MTNQQSAPKHIFYCKFYTVLSPRLGKNQIQKHFQRGLKRWLGETPQRAPIPIDKFTEIFKIVSKLSMNLRMVPKVFFANIMQDTYYLQKKRHPPSSEGGQESHSKIISRAKKIGRNPKARQHRFTSSHTYSNRFEMIHESSKEVRS